MVFKLRACGHTNLLLGTKFRHYESDRYELELGSSGNTKISLLRNGLHVHSVDSNALLQCDTSQWFWASWAEGNVKLGRFESVGEYELFNWQDSDPLSVVTLGVSLKEDQADVSEWLIAEDQGKHICEEGRTFNLTHFV